jgi:hypothetical protein
MYCPNCKSEGTSRLKLQNGNPIDVKLKSDKRLYNQTANVVQCPECKDIHLLTQEYLEDGRTVFCEREHGFFEPENSVDIPKVENVYLNGLDRIIEFKYSKKYKKHVQFTGLLDKKENKIYEGDRLTSNVNYVLNGVVMWQNCCFVIKWDNNNGFNQLFEEEAKYYEIISEEI